MKLLVEILQGSLIVVALIMTASACATLLRRRREEDAQVKVALAQCVLDDFQVVCVAVILTVILSVFS